MEHFFAQLKLIRFPALIALIFLTMTSQASPLVRPIASSELKVLGANDPFLLRSAKLWMRNGDEEERCSATIVDKRLLLTAAHCVVDWDPEEIQVILTSKATDSWEQGVAFSVQNVLFPADTDLDLIRQLRTGIPASVLDISDYALVILSSEIPEPFVPAVLSTTPNPMRAAPLILTGFGITPNFNGSGFFHKYSATAFPPEGLKTEVYLRTTMCAGDSGGGVFESIPGVGVALAAVTSRGGFCGPGEATWLPAKASEWIQATLALIKN